MDTNTKRPASQFYWGDHLRDPAVRSVSLAARGLWVDVMCLMHEGDPYGHLRTGKRDTTVEILARMVGSPVGTVRKLLAELEDAGVFSRNDDGVIFSRRMVRDERLRNVRAAGGALSLKNPNVPRKKDRSSATSKDRLEDTLRRDAHPSIDLSPASASASASSSTSAFASARLSPGHRNHVYCPDGKGRFCVPEFLHHEFIAMLGTHADTFDLTRWYREVDEHAADEGAPVSDPLRFWRARFRDDLVVRGFVPPKPGPPATADELRKAGHHARQTGGCRHAPLCEDGPAHRRRLINAWREGTGLGPLPAS